MQEVQFVRSGFRDVERVDGDVLLAKAKLQVPTVEEPSERPIAVSEIEHYCLDRGAVIFVLVTDRPL